MKFDKKKGAILDRKKLVDPKMRALAETPHIVKPRELGKNKVQAQAVSFPFSQVVFTHNMRKVYPFGTSLRRTSGPVLGPSLHI